MKRKLYNYAKATCKICTLFGGDTKLLGTLDWDIIQEMNYLVFLRKYNTILSDKGIKIRLVSSNYYRHKNHMEEKRITELRKSMGEGEEGRESLNPECAILKESYMVDNLFLKTTFNQRLQGLSDLGNILSGKREELKKLRRILQVIEEKMSKEIVDLGPYNKLAIRQINVKRNIDYLESSIRNYVKDIHDLSKDIEETYHKRSEKFREDDLEAELRKRLSLYFLKLNDSINTFMMEFRMYLEWDEFQDNSVVSTNIIRRTSKMLTNTITKSIDEAYKVLPSGNISGIPGVKAVEETVESLRVLSSGKPN